MKRRAGKASVIVFLFFFLHRLLLKNIHGKLQFIIVFRLTLTLLLLKQVIVAL